MKKKLYRVPLKQRSTELGSAILWHKFHDCIVTNTKLGKTGIFIGYDEKQQISDQNFINKHLFGLGDTHAIVSAYSIEDAIETFYREWYGANIGGESYESRALYINVSEPILEFPPCDLIHQDKNERYECGEIQNGHGAYGGCVLEDYDSPDFFCPIHEFVCNLPRDYVRKIVVNGVEYSYIRPGRLFRIIQTHTAKELECVD